MEYITKAMRMRTIKVLIQAIANEEDAGVQIDYKTIAEEEYFEIVKNDHVLYTVNVTGDSVLTAAAELMKKIADKF